MMTSMLRDVFVIDSCVWILQIHKLIYGVFYTLSWVIYFQNRNSCKRYSPSWKPLSEKYVWGLSLRSLQNINQVHDFHGCIFCLHSSRPHSTRSVFLIFHSSIQIFCFFFIAPQNLFFSFFFSFSFSFPLITACLFLNHFYATASDRDFLRLRFPVSQHPEKRRVSCMLS